MRAEEVDVTADMDLMNKVSSSPDSPSHERQFANAALDRLLGRSVRGVVSILEITDDTSDPLAVQFKQRLMSFGCLLCPEPILLGEVAIIWTSVHAVHRRCVEAGLRYEEIPDSADVPGAIARLQQRGRISQ